MNYVNDRLYRAFLFTEFFEEALQILTRSRTSPHLAETLAGNFSIDTFLVLTSAKWPLNRALIASIGHHSDLSSQYSFLNEVSDRSRTSPN